MKARPTVLVTITALVLLSAASHAQWVNHPTPGIPRLPDGKPNLSAPAPRLADGHPDLSGIWDVGNMIYFHDLAQRPEARRGRADAVGGGVQKAARDRNHVDDPYGYCLPLGVPRINLAARSRSCRRRR